MQGITSIPQNNENNKETSKRNKEKKQICTGLVRTFTVMSYMLEGKEEAMEWG